MKATNTAHQLPWADSARALCVCLVVLMHAEAQVAVAGWAEYDRIIDIWHSINTFLQPIRMPTFFTISGILVSDSIYRPKAHSPRKGFFKPMYLYVIWAAIFAWLVPNYPAFDDTEVKLIDRIKEILLLGSPAWYLYALGLYYLIARAMRSLGLSTAMVLAVCFLISLFGAILLPNEEVYASKLSHCLFFFVAGVRLKDRIIAFAEAATLTRCAVFLAMYVVCSILAHHVDLHLLPLDMAAMGFGLTAFSLIYARLGSFADAARWVGRRTLFIYLLHFPLICSMSAVTRRYLDHRVLESFWAGMAYPVVATVVIVPASLALGVLMKRIGLNWLFELPKRAEKMAVSPA